MTKHADPRAPHASVLATVCVGPSAGELQMIHMCLNTCWITTLCYSFKKRITGGDGDLGPLVSPPWESVYDQNKWVFLVPGISTRT